MPTITEGVEFANVAREWRMKWSEDGDKKSLAEVQKVLDAKIAAVKAVAGALIFWFSSFSFGFCVPTRRTTPTELSSSSPRFPLTVRSFPRSPFLLLRGQESLPRRRRRL